MENDQMRAQLVSELGGGATLTHGAKCAKVIFDNDFALAADIEDRAPVCTMLSSEIGCLSLRADSLVTVVNPLEDVTKDYRVRRIEPDGTGMSRVILKAV